MERIKKVQRYLIEQKLEGIIVDNPCDIYYLLGIELSLGRLYVTSRGATLYVDGRYLEACKKTVRCKVALFPKKAPWQGKKIGFDAQFTSYQEYARLAKRARLTPLDNPMATFRQVKEASEIALLEKASQLNVEGFKYAKSLLREGITEEEVAQALEIFYLQKGGNGLSFKPIIAFGPHSAEPHYRAGKGKLKKNDLVLIDIGVIYNHYHSDLTRVVFKGKRDKELEKIHHIVALAKAAALEKCRPGVRISEVDAAARHVIEEAGYGKYFTHSLGHGVGLDIHEAPRIREKQDQLLEKGMVITIEPGIYLPGRGGVRLEDLLVITPKGHKNLTLKSLNDFLVCR